MLWKLIMKLRELKEKLDKLDPKYLDRDVQKAVATAGKAFLGEPITRILCTENIMIVNGKEVRGNPEADKDLEHVILL